MKLFKFVSRALLIASLTGAAYAQQVITLRGASQFGDDHAFTKTMVRFEELVKKYYGKPINFVIHKNECGQQQQADCSPWCHLLRFSSSDPIAG